MALMVMMMMMMKKDPNMATGGVISLLSHPHDRIWHMASTQYLLNLFGDLKKNVHLYDTCENMKLDD